MKIIESSRNGQRLFEEQEKKCMIPNFVEYKGILNREITRGALKEDAQVIKAINEREAGRMITKEDLKQYSALCLEAEQLKDEIEQLRASVYSISASTVSDMPTSATKNNDRMINVVIRVDEMELLYNKKVNELIEYRKRIEKEIERLEPIERMLIRYRYFNNLKWEEVAIKIGYSWAQMHRLHAKILIRLKQNDTQ